MSPSSKKIFPLTWYLLYGCGTALGATGAGRGSSPPSFTGCGAAGAVADGLPALVGAALDGLAAGEGVVLGAVGGSGLAGSASMIFWRFQNPCTAGVMTFCWAHLSQSSNFQFFSSSADGSLIVAPVAALVPAVPVAFGPAASAAAAASLSGPQLDTASSVRAATDAARVVRAVRAVRPCAAFGRSPRTARDIADMRSFPP